MTGLKGTLPNLLANYSATEKKEFKNGEVKNHFYSKPHKQDDNLSN